ncbi:MAG: GLUG motif-containing protein, partial [Planctomycetota bacterium]
MSCTGVYNELIVYDPNLSLEQEAISPAPEGYYWWVCDGNEVQSPVYGTAYGEIQIQTDEHMGLFSIDYMLGNSATFDGLGLNVERSNNHLIEVVDEYTPRELQAVNKGGSVFLSWIAPSVSEGLIGYNVYRDGQVINESLVLNTTFVDEHAPGGVFSYTVSSLYDTGDAHAIPYEVKVLVFSGGTGEPNDPYQVTTFILVNDIDLNPNLPGAGIFEQAVIPDFYGTFDGNGHTILHLTITGESYLGLFGQLRFGAEISNLGLEAVDVNGTGDNVGGLVGSNDGGSITTSYGTGTVSGYRYVGGLVGGNCGGNIVSSYSTGSVGGNDCVGGLVGENEGSITTSYSTGTVSGDYDVGGLVGENDSQGSITTSYSSGSVNGTGDYIGGLVGRNDGSIVANYSTGAVSGGNSVGGLVGYNKGIVIASSYSSGTVTGWSWVGGLVGQNGGSITACYSTASVNGNHEVGGLVGLNNGSITSCYSTGTVSGSSDIGGIVGSGGGLVLQSVWDMETSGLTVSNGSVGLTTSEMMDPYMLGLNGFANDPNWVLDAGRDYPRLAWEGTAGQIIPEPIIDWLSGQGTEEEPYRIDSADQLISLRRASGLWDKYFILGADIDLDPNLQGGQVFSQAVIQVFSGVFDGNDHTISHLTISGDSYLGLFGRLGPGAIISNLALESVNINGTGDSVGGLVGSNGGSMATSYSTGTVSGRGDNVGGLVGINSGSLTTSYSTGTVRGGSYSGTGDNVGGLVGINSGSLTTSYSTSAVIGVRRVGGIIGYNRGSITESY